MSDRKTVESEEKNGPIQTVLRGLGKPVLVVVLCYYVVILVLVGVSVLMCETLLQ